MPLPEDTLKGAAPAADLLDADVYLLNGHLERARDLECVQAVHQHANHTRALLLPVTNGGDPDAAYKIARYFQDKYETFSVLISGVCKSAGTLLAVGAHEIIFTPFGELGPLDIQSTKVDRFDQLQSGLTIQDALKTLEQSATDSFYKIISDYIRTNNGMISFATASKAASDFVTQLYAPVFSRIDPEEVGQKSRAMRIATDYGRRLAVKTNNLKSQDSLRLLAETYSSHSFVIDQREATTLFKNVRAATEPEKALVGLLGRVARFEQSGGPYFVPLSKRRENTAEIKEGSVKNGQQDQRSGGPPADGGDIAQAAPASVPEAKPRRRRLKPVEGLVAAGNGTN